MVFIIEVVDILMETTLFLTLLREDECWIGYDSTREGIET